MEKDYIFGVDEYDNDKFPWGLYFIEKTSNKLYVSQPGEKPKRKINIGALGFIAICIGIIIVGTALLTLSAMVIDYLILTNARQFLLLMFLGLVVLTFIAIGFAVSKSTKTQRQLIEDAGFQLIECNENEEYIFLQKNIPSFRKPLVMCISSFLVTCGLGYLFVTASPLVIFGMYHLVYLLAFATSLMFSLLFFVIRVALRGRKYAKQKLRILRGEIGND